MRQITERSLSGAHHRLTSIGRRRCSAASFLQLLSEQFSLLGGLVLQFSKARSLRRIASPDLVQELLGVVDPQGIVFRLQLCGERGR